MEKRRVEGQEVRAHPTPHSRLEKSSEDPDHSPERSENPEQPARENTHNRSHTEPPCLTDKNDEVPRKWTYQEYPAKWLVAKQD